MPSEYLFDLTKQSLANININNSYGSRIESGQVLKDKITTGNGINVESLDENRIKCTFQDNQFFSALYNEINIYGRRIKRQNEVSTYLAKSRRSPLAWLIVTSYYSSFYSANLLNKLLGTYVMHLNSSDIKSIIMSNSIVNYKIKSGTYLSSGFNIYRDDSQIELVFAHKKSQPHQTTWDVINKYIKLTDIKLIKNDSRRSRLLLFKNILSSDHGWQMPSAIRNYWNYSDHRSYEINHDRICSDFKPFLLDESGKGIMAWSSDQQGLYVCDKNFALCILFLQYCMTRVILDVVEVFN